MRLKPNAYWILQGYAHAKLSANMVDEAEQLLCRCANLGSSSRIRHADAASEITEWN